MILIVQLGRVIKLVKIFDQFGGWLKCIYVIHWVAIIVLGILPIVYVLLFFIAENINEMIQYVIALFEILIYIILCIKIVKVIKIKEINVPNRIIKLMAWIVFFSVFIGVSEELLDYLNLGIEGVENSGVGKRLFGGIFWFVIWREYFIRSKRVLTYYGQNAGKLNKVVKKGE